MIEDWKRTLLDRKFRNYHAIKCEYEKNAKDIIFEDMASDPEKVIGGDGKKGSVTEQKGLQLLEQLHNWAVVVEKTFDHFMHEWEYDIMRDYYFGDHKKSERTRNILKKYHFSNRQSFHYCKDRWLTVAEKWAKYYGLLQSEKQQENTVEIMIG